MKPIIFIFITVMLINVSSFAKNADVICIYKESVRKDVTQPAQTIDILHKNAIDIDCCKQDDSQCTNRMESSVKRYCDDPERVPDGYTLSRVKIICGKGFAGAQEGVEYPLE